MGVIRDEQDGMLDGLDEQKRGLALVLQRVDARLLQESDSVQQQLNQMRAEVSAAISGKGSLNVEPEKPPKSPPLSSESSPPPGYGPGERGDKAAVMALSLAAGGGEMEEGMGPLGFMGSPQRDTGDDSMPLDNILGGGAPPPRSPLVPRLRARQCVADDAVPASLRCAALVVGRRLFLFPKGRDGMCDLQYAMVMEVNQSLRMWALRVMGSLPLRCRCMFVVVQNAVCVLPTDSSGRCDLRQTFVLTNGEGERVYSQGCYVEFDTPGPCYCRCVVAGALILLFPHDGEDNYMLQSVCVLDTATLTLRVANGFPPVGDNALTAAPCKLAIAVTKPFISPDNKAVASDVKTVASPGASETPPEPPKVLCVPMTETLSWRLDLGWVADATDGLSCRALSIAPGGGRLPPDSGFVLQVVGDLVYIVAHDNHKILDFDETFVVDTHEATIAPVEFSGADLPVGCPCQLFTVAGKMIVIPEDTESCLDLSEIRILDCTSQRNVQVVRHPVDNLPPRGDLRAFVQEDVLLLLPYSCTTISVVDPCAMLLQTFALDHLPKSSYGFELEMCDADLIFIPLDSAGRRCVSQVSVLNTAQARPISVPGSGAQNLSIGARPRSSTFAEPSSL